MNQNHLQDAEEEPLFLRWLKENKKDDPNNAGGLFDIFIWNVNALLLSARDGIKQKTHPVTGRRLDILAFEVGCMLLQRLDLYLFCHTDDHGAREKMLMGMHRNFVELFSGFCRLPTKDLHVALNERLVLHASLIKEAGFGTKNFSKDSMQRYYDQVAQLVIGSVKHGLPVMRCRSIEEIPLELNALEVYRVSMTLVAFEVSMISGFLEEAKHFV